MKNRIWIVMNAMAMAAVMALVSPCGAARLSLAVEGTEVSKEVAEEKAEVKANASASEEKTETKTEETVAETKPETKAEETASEEKPETKTEETASEEKPETKTEETASEEKTETKAEETASEEKPETKSEESASEKKEEAKSQDKTQEENELSPDQQAAKEAEAAKKALQNDPNHEHNFRWIAKMNESESADGTMNYICEECGKIWFFSPCSPYVAFQGEIAHRIETAAEGERIEVKTSHFINFDKQVMKALSEREDVSVYVSFLDGEYKGNRVSFVIPAGEDTMSLLDENGYCGFIYLGNKYGLTVEEVEKTDEVAATKND